MQSPGDKAVPEQYTRKYKAFIFDLDGVITDTAEYHYLGWQRMAEEEGIPFNRRDNEQLRGVSRRASLGLILKGRSIPEEKMQELMERKNAYYQELISKMTPADILPGALDLLKALQQKDFRLALASASKNARQVVERLNLEIFFDAIADGYSVDKTKPAPDLFLYAASLISVPPPACVVVEDAEAGVAAARAAGMVTVGIGPPERVGAADLIYPSLAAIDADQMLAALPG